MLKWDKKEEMLVDVNASPEDQQRVRDSVLQKTRGRNLSWMLYIISLLSLDLLALDSELAAYPFDEKLKKWLSLTDRITRATLARCV